VIRTSVYVSIEPALVVVYHNNLQERYPTLNEAILIRSPRLLLTFI